MARRGKAKAILSAKNKANPSLTNEQGEPLESTKGSTILDDLNAPNATGKSEKGCAGACLLAHHRAMQSTDPQGYDSNVKNPLDKLTQFSTSTRTTKNPGDWIPGDIGSVENPTVVDRAARVGIKNLTATEVLQYGENIIYVGKGEFIGYTGKVEKKRLNEWVKRVGAFPTNKSGRATLKNLRTSPTTGLLRKPKVR